MNPGLLSQRVIIQQRSTTQDADGQPLEVWSPVATLWADVRHVSGLETIKSDTDTSIVKASVRIRYRSDINAGMRVAHGSMVYDIKAVLPDLLRKSHIDLVCELVA